MPVLPGGDAVLEDLATRARRSRCCATRTGSSPRRCGARCRASPAPRPRSASGSGRAGGAVVGGRAAGRGAGAAAPGPGLGSRASWSGRPTRDEWDTVADLLGRTPGRVVVLPWDGATAATTGTTAARCSTRRRATSPARCSSTTGCSSTRRLVPAEDPWVEDVAARWPRPIRRAAPRAGVRWVLVEKGMARSDVPAGAGRPRRGRPAPGRAGAPTRSSARTADRRRYRIGQVS